MPETTVPPPRWDLTAAFPGVESPELASAFAAITAGVAALAEQLGELAVEQPTASVPVAATVAALDEALARYNALLEQTQTIDTYLTCLLAVDARDSQARSAMSRLRPAQAALEQLGARFARWTAAQDLDALLAQSPYARAHRYALERAHQSAQRQMSAAEEQLAGELRLSGGRAWDQLYDTITAQLTVRLDQNGQTAVTPLSALRNAAYAADRNLRRAAHAAELEAWQSAAAPLAAALNGIKGEVLTLSRRRGWESPLAESLFANHIDRATLDAMFAAARATFPELRRYFKAKARAMGLERLAWYDIFAPVGSATFGWDYAAATEFIVQQFGTYSERLSGFAARAVRERWIDPEPRPGKRAGAFSLRLRPGESRILANYAPGFVGMSIIAHELGHAYHDFNLRDRTPLQSAVPETLAETASIFCETLVSQAALQTADAAQQIAILDVALQGSAQRVIGVSSRFLFEERLFDQRARRELTIAELCALMVDAQQETYGDGLDPHSLHPYLWAAKVHYFNPDLSYYNYPYLFGLLFALGLYAEYRRDPEVFRARYDALLAATGSADAATLAARFGFDLRAPEFWQASLAVIVADVDRFERLVSHPEPTDAAAQR